MLISDKTDPTTKFLARQLDILFVDCVREPGKPLGEKPAKVEELELFGRFLTSAHHPEVIELPLDGRLAKILGVAEEGEMGLA